MYREGAQIAWLTNDPDAQLWGEKIHGRVFRQRISRGSCGQILDGGAVDCAVLLTAPWRELASGGASRGSLPEMLDAVLEEAAATGTRKVCLPSSEMLAEEEPLDAGLEELRAAERLAEAFCRQHDVSLLVVRMGLLFDKDASRPRAYLAGRLAAEMAAGAQARCPFAPDSRLDLLSASDAADAFLRLYNLEADGVHTVLSGASVTARELCAAARAAGAPENVSYGTLDYACDEGRAEAVRLLCGWMPFHLFAEEGEEHLRKDLRQEAPSSEPTLCARWRQLAQGHPLVWETVQNLILFVVACLFAALAEDWSDLRYVDVRLLYVIIIAICFGMRQGLLATVLACASYAVSLLPSGIDVSYLGYSVSTWIPFIVYGVAGAFGGYWSDKKNDEYDTLSQQFFLPHTQIYRPDAFSRELETLKKIDETYGCPYSVARVRRAQRVQSPWALYRQAEPLLRATDFMGVGADDEVRAVFLYVDGPRRQQIQERLESGGLVVEWED